MKRYLSILMPVFISMIIVGCASTVYRANPYPQQDLTKETWQRAVDTTSANWARGASRWFLTGDPNQTETANMRAAQEVAVSTMEVSVGQFNNVKINAPFQVQLFATSLHNSVFVYGPNSEIQNVAIVVRGDTLYINTAKNMPSNAQTQNVIIRVGIVNLNCLETQGRARVEGRLLHSNRLKIISKGSGNIYLSGPVNLQSVKVISSGCVSVFGAVAPVLDITTGGTGTVNVIGNIGVRTITHKNQGDINLVGVNSDGVRIFAYGRGKIGLSGRMNLCDVTAQGHTQVYAMYVNGNKLNVYASGNACVGIAGTTGDFYVNAADNARVYGRSLCAVNAYARASYHGHINVAATNKVYASAIQSSSIYFFGKPAGLSQFVSDNGMIMPIWADAHSSCFIPNAVGYKDRPVSSYRYNGGTARVIPLEQPSMARSTKVTPLYSRPEMKTAPAPEGDYIFRRKRVTNYTPDM